MSPRRASGCALIPVACLASAIAGCPPDSGPSDTAGATARATTAARAGDTAQMATFSGVGRLRAGMRIQEAVAAVGGTVDSIYDAIPGSSCNYVRFSALPAGTDVMVWGDTVMRVDVDSSTVRTRWGTGVGSTEAEIRQRHAEHTVRRDLHPYSAPTWHYMIVDAPGDTLHRIIFETDDRQRAHSYRVGFRRAVDLIEGCS